MLFRILTVFLLGAATSTVAAETTTPARIISSADVTQWLLALCAVLAIFAILVWLLRKTGGLTPGAKTPLALLGGLSLGMRERLVLVKVGDKQLLLAVTPGRIDKLMILEGEQRLFQNQEQLADDATFAAKLQRIMQGQNHE